MDLKLQERVVLVVGGRGYIGAAIVERLRAEGATVVVASRTAGDDGVKIDAGNQASVTSGVAAVLAKHGRIDGLVVTAAPAADTLDPDRSDDPSQVLDAFAGKAMTFLRLVNAVKPIMREAGFGRVVGVSGQNAYLTGNITAQLRNAGLNLSAKNLADDLAGTGVAVNTINPGGVSDEPTSDVQTGLPGQSSPAQIADLTAFLLSPLSSTSGESISVGHRVRGVGSF